MFLNDGVYGSLFELPMIGVIDRIEVLTHRGRCAARRARARRIVFGPTCNSVDRLSGRRAAGLRTSPRAISWCSQGMGAYSTVTNTRFNGFGELSIATVLSLNI